MLIIDIDEIKKTLPGYIPDKANEYQEASAKLADKELGKELKKRKNCNINVILMCGGSASGKTEFVDVNFRENNYFKLPDQTIVFDSTLRTIHGAEIKIKNIINSKNKPQIYFILPDSLSRCFAAFKKRERKIPEPEFYKTHSGAREVVLWIAKQYPEIEIFIYYNYLKTSKNHKEDQLIFEELYFATRKEMIDFLENEQYTPGKIQELVINNR